MRATSIPVLPARIPGPGSCVALIVEPEMSLPEGGEAELVSFVSGSPSEERETEADA